MTYARPLLSCSKAAKLTTSIIGSFPTPTTDVNFVRLFGGLVEGALDATWEVTGPSEWKVIFQTITFKLLGIPAVDKKPLPGQAGVWKLTYLGAHHA